MYLYACRSTQGAPDWTCVIVGFSSGHIRIYTEVCFVFLNCFIAYFADGEQIFRKWKQKLAYASR